ncbi:MAG TPA: CoB--CoM heterodisulfide reductase iron-sulfur subunit B family protein [candidate division Zixibacteria bacterium]|nr:CoB--CoM heterodisulfide reductase iron-sulfur subunit B family protein [candidate division Zixibacteria bacterium]
MTKYAYYPGCSLESLAVSYNLSAVAAARELGLELVELDDWNCCGATSYFHIDELFAHTLVARNIAIAEKEGLDFVAPCSGCFKNAYFTNEHLKEDPDLADHINYALAADDLSLNGSTKVRHLLDVFIEDVGYEGIKEKVTTPLDGLRVAPYYGCQLVRPRKNGEEIENPQFFEGLISAIGADPVDYSSKMRCCGGSLIVTNRKAALDMVYRLLLDASNRDTDVIATICPMCNVNLEVYQKQVNREYNTNFDIPAMYFTQLIGLALGIAPGRLGIGKELVSMAPSLLA